MSLQKKLLEQQKENLELKINKLEQEVKTLDNKSHKEKKIVVTDSDYQMEEGYSDILDDLNDEESSSKNNENQNLKKINEKLQEKVNQLQMELNKQILNDNFVNNH